MKSRTSGRIRCPARAFWPFVPRPEVLPRLPPRPTRREGRRFVFELRVLSSMGEEELGFRKARWLNQAKCFDGGAGVVELILTAREKFPRDVRDASELEHRAHRTAGYQPAARRRCEADG